jgi:hypothetical protein
MLSAFLIIPNAHASAFKMVKWEYVSAGLLALLFVCGAVIWSCMYAIIYHPLLHLNWKKANCTITEVRFFRIYSTIGTDINVYTTTVESNSTQIGTGYSCASSAYEASISLDLAFSNYPYEYIRCDNSFVSGQCNSGELLQPSWFCVDYNDQEKFPVGGRVECKYHINGDEHAKNYTYPQDGEDFIDVLFKDEVYIPMADYIALWVCVFGLMCVLPCILLSCLGLFIPLGWCSLAERQKYKDFYRRFLCCRRKQVPICIKACGDLQAQIPPAPSIVWLYTVKNHPEHFPLKTTLVREIADFLS